MDFVDDEDLVFADDRGVLHAFDDVADVLDAGIGSGIYFLDVHGVAAGDILAAVALATGVQRVAALAVQGAGEDSGTGGLAHAAGAGKEEGMVQATALDCVLEGFCDMFLSDHVGERLRTPLAGHCYVCHGWEYSKKVGSRQGLVVSGWWLGFRLQV